MFIENDWFINTSNQILTFFYSNGEPTIFGNMLVALIMIYGYWLFFGSER